MPSLARAPQPRASRWRLVALAATVLGASGALPARAAPGDLLITEIMANPTCADDTNGEWVELTNASAADIDLAGFHLADEGSDDFTFPASLVVAPGGRVVLCRKADPAVNGGVACHLAYAGFLLANTEDEVLLRDAGGALVDRVAYSSALGFSIPAGASLSLDPGADAAANDLPGAWCAAQGGVPAGCGDKGSPGAPNDDCPADCPDGDADGHRSAACGGDDCDDARADVHPGVSEACLGGLDEDCDGQTDADDPDCQGTARCGDGVVQTGEGCDDGNTAAADGCSDACQLEPGWACRPGVAPSQCGSAAAAGELVVTEILNDPSCVTDDRGEWVELWNPTQRELELRGWRLGDDMDTWEIPGLRLAPGARTVLCRHGDTAANGGVSCALVFTGVQLNNSSDSVNLLDPAGTVVDRVAYDGGPSFPSPSGASLSLEPGFDAAANDAGGSWCAAQAPIPGGCGDRGSPGAENESCQSPCPDGDGDDHRSAACGGDDCQDGDPAVHPGAPEVCGDGVDQDCAGGDLTCACPDDDDDGHPQTACGGDDCDDTQAFVHPGAAEVCGDRLDNDCDSQVDSEDPDCRPACQDQDADGFDALACGGDDCDDGASAVNPDADERCADGLDNDCDGLMDRFDPDCGSTCQDLDGDGHQDATCGGDDCDDTDLFVHPGQVEVCDDALDNDCDTLADALDPDCQAASSGCAYAGPGPGAAGGLTALGLVLAWALGWPRRGSRP
ncbi:MAG TPA: MopE-related protein [Myxococcota bacterium]|nr:MopE-related protein [Myxococcota bacterium]HRY96454.1 MopE-related protein [Myxococcota bacterium]HSA22347.1 MopE-related protein [Myxococcota bacterium]